MATRTLIAGALVGLTVLAGCGDDGADDATTSTVAAGATTAVSDASTDAAADTTVSAVGSSSPAIPAAATDSSAAATAGDDSAVPTRIVSLAPTHTETLYAIGAGAQVIAVDDQSNFPPESATVKTDLSGFEPNIEAIAGYEPDLVVTSGPADLTAQLEALGITVWAGPAAKTFAEAYTQIEQLGAVTGHVAEAAELVGQMQTDIAEVAASMPTSETPLSVYHELSPDGYSVDSTTFIGEVYTTLGLQNIADQAEGDTGGYPQLNAETIIAADPDLVFLADTKCCQESLETVSARPGWDAMTAVVDGNVFAMDDDIASRWGPRVVEYVQQVAAAVEQVLVPSGG